MNFFQQLLQSGTEYAVARENRKEAALLPAAPMTPNEQVVQQSPSQAVVQNDKLVATSEPFNWQKYVAPVAISAAAIVVGGLILSGLKAASKGRKK